MTKLILGFAVATLAFASFSASAADGKDTKRKTASSGMPPDALGMPAGLNGGGSGMPPGALGMPMPQDSACRRAASMAAVNEALTEIQHSQDCQVESVDSAQLNSKYNVTVNCGDTGSFKYTVMTVTSPKGCRGTSVKSTN